ncbi:tryptophan aminotransferase-related protein 1-like [Lotus japonicus]|uniref:tryptophan aminotransferase-related protein 1-like n=1 Tax=Lotus japonicus TaxID=34305 RepID=UPI00258E2795|nr:tryptophan aminotransferase-related protein 1-like [Lotus japonicus]
MVVSKASPPVTCSDSTINLEKGDPLVFGKYWKKKSDECSVVIQGWEFLSYLSDTSNVCWYMLPELKGAIQRLHHVVGNAVTQDKYIVIGTGSTQLFMAALFALSPSQTPDHPINVVSAAPHYSEYKPEIDVLRSAVVQWAGDAGVYDKNEPYIEVVNYPNNPDGTIRGPVVKSAAKGNLVHDLAYYWPQYTPITHQADHDVMLFTFSKCTGHAGSRIGWAIVKDIEIAKKMTRFVHLGSHGVAKESQARAAKIMGAICDDYQKFESIESELFFGYCKNILRERWEKLKGAIEKSKVFTLTKYPRAYCNFANESFETYPAFAWLKCEEGIENGESYMGKLKIRARGGPGFGVGPNYVRLTMIGMDDDFNELLKRLSMLSAIQISNSS